MSDLPRSQELEKAARISECGQFRYSLTRHWSTSPGLVFVMLNPSTADADLDDPTIRRCMGFARRDGYGGIQVLNLYAYRATDPKVLLACADPVGPANDDYLRLTLTTRAGNGLPVVAAWGANADRDPDRVSTVLELVPGVNWRCLGHSKSGAPKHPLYIKGDQPLVPLLAPDATGRTVPQVAIASAWVTRWTQVGSTTRPVHRQIMANRLDPAPSQAELDRATNQVYPLEIHDPWAEQKP